MTNTENKTARFETRSVLAGAYRGGKSVPLTHLVDVEADAPDGFEWKVVCGRAVHVADSFAGDRTARPSCPRCAAKWDKLRAAGAL